ncbi:mandelate racemase/muconate lactonizing enzyme family protein [Microbacterium schleiferi]|uniref:Mandelate racemase/muconate lactonizing enzyme family protein n=1 Tax=Microbacterium schleiferi TaxID=69362 RepID=A0A7S8MUX7_9MICO|nr:mandelate racemase/muconate lactonizing enzyme family protein [Microbacterium schleiferi]QPE03458.1 mandelate racemase/muconate lactonizing enzyme family protein [Microbacterium schleiferi]
MRIVEVETLRPAFQPNLCVVRLRTDDGLEALGEAYYSAEAVEVYIHASLVPLLLGSADLSPEKFAAVAHPYVGYQGGGVETRAIGAIDIALWDLMGKRASLPVAELLGGPVRDGVRVYNTCAGPGYVSTTSRQHSSNWGLETAGVYEDLHAFLHRPAELTAELRDEGITGMKVWPFDRFAEESRGNEISGSQLREGLRVIEQIRTVADASEMALMVELHGLWNRPTATRIIRALSDYDPYWVEDPIRADGIDALARLREDVSVPLAIGETAVGIRGFLPLLQSGAASFATVDAQWTGGLSQARRVAALADAFLTPIAPHDCTGPVTFAAVCHLTISQPNAVIQESVRAFLRTWYPEVVEGLPTIADGMLTISSAPGLGISLSPG